MMDKFEELSNRLQKLNKAGFDLVKKLKKQRADMAIYNKQMINSCNVFTNKINSKL